MTKTVSNSGDLDGVTEYYHNSNQIIETRDGSANLETQVYHGTQQISDGPSLSARTQRKRKDKVCVPRIPKRLLHSRTQTELPPIVTHHMVDDATDPVLAHLRHRHLFNNKHDRVKVVFHPEFINRTNPLFSMDYPEFVRGCHLGVFPSYYEPWGYTPAECAVMGIPSICTDLSGFGAFMQAQIPDHDQNGIFVLKRRHRDPEDSIAQLADIMIRFCALDRRERIQMRNRVERLAQCLDWTELNPAYEEARALAMQRAFGAEPAIKN